MECGGPFVVTCGTTWMLQSYVDNWATHLSVSIATPNFETLQKIKALEESYMLKIACPPY